MLGHRSSSKSGSPRGAARAISVLGAATVLLVGTAAAAPAAVHHPGGKKQERRDSRGAVNGKAKSSGRDSVSINGASEVVNKKKAKRVVHTVTGSTGGRSTPPATPEAPRTPEAPATPETPSTPEAPAAPEAPVTPGTPSTPEGPVTEVPTTTETPTQPTPPTESPLTGGSTAGLLFDGTKLGDYDVEAVPGAITEVADPAGSGASVFDLTVHNSDVYPLTPTDNPRAQALTPPIIRPNGEYWLQTKFFIPKGMPYVPGWLSLVSIYGPPFNGSSPWQISINEHELRWMRNFEHENDIPWKAPLANAEGNWTTILLHEKFGTQGFVEMWVNGQQIKFFPKGNRNPSKEPETTHLEMATMDSSNDAGINSAKIMQYREAGMFEVANVYFGALKVGTSRAAVES